MKKKSQKKNVSPLEFALDLELKSVNMYLRLAVEARNPLGKKLFYSLAVEEVEHAKRVDALFNKLAGDDSHKVLLNRTLPPITSELKRFFLRSQTKDVENEREDLSGYKLALKMEKSSYAAYEGFSKSAKTEIEQKFFRSLMKEENEHLDALVNVYSYLTKTDDWFQAEESKVWNWMNM